MCSQCNEPDCDYQVFSKDAMKLHIDKEKLTYVVVIFRHLTRDVLNKKTKVLDIFNTDKKCFMQINIESSPSEIWIRIRFLEINGSQSLNK